MHKILAFVWYINREIGGCSSIGRATVCGTVRSLFESGYPPSNALFRLNIIRIKGLILKPE